MCAALGALLKASTVTAVIRRERSLRKFAFGVPVQALQLPENLRADWPLIADDVLAGNNAGAAQVTFASTEFAVEFAAPACAMTPLDPALYRDLVRRAIAEDVGPGDVTTNLLVPADARSTARLIAKSDCVVAGLDVARAVFAEVDPSVVFTARVEDGHRCRPGDVIAELTGPARALLTAERTALNFLQHLSGIATLTRRFVDATGGRLTILDTRKTIPTLRALAKYAVRCGGGTNHRMGLFDAVLIKDNHVRLAGSVGEAVRRVRDRGVSLPIEVEAQSLAEVDEAIAARPDVIMLDNLSDAEMREAVARIGGRAKVEISGGVTLDRIPVLAGLGADVVSVGALTHSAPAADISLEMPADAGSDSR